MMPLQNPFRKSIQITWLCLALTLLLPLAFQGLGADPVLAWVLGGVGAIVCLIILPILYVTGRRYLREMEELVSGQYLVHWQLDPEEWHRFTEADWARGRREAVTTPLWVGGVGVGLGLILGLIAGDFSGMPLWLIIGCGAVALVLGTLLYTLARSTYQKRLQTAGEVYIGTKGVLNGTSYSSWLGYGMSLTGVAIEESSPMAIRFEITANAGNGTSTTQLRVPVPRGREEEAIRLVAQFHGEG